MVGGAVLGLDTVACFWPEEEDSSDAGAEISTDFFNSEDEEWDARFVDAGVVDNPDRHADFDPHADRDARNEWDHRFPDMGEDMAPDRQSDFAW